MRVKMTPWFVLSLLIILYTTLPVLAVENPCPSDFNPDDVSWALVSMEKVKESEYIVERTFFYQKNPELRVAGREPSGCFGSMLSFLIQGREERAIKRMYSNQGGTYYLRVENGEWKRGSRVLSASISPGRIMAVLYGEDDKVIVRREFVISEPSELQEEEEGE